MNYRMNDTDTIDYLSGLNPQQREAVVNYDGPTLIIAGAGSGKTRVLTMRIAYMLQQGVSPASIMALTFTNKAAREMRERIMKVVPPEALRGLWVGTFHNVFGRILRNEAELIGFPPTFTIYDTADSRNLIKNIVRSMDLADDRYKPNVIQGRISLAKNNLTPPDAYAANAALMAEDAEAQRPRTADIYAAYMRQCKTNGAMDFDDMLLYTNFLLRDHPEVLAKYSDRFRYILVDEYQDTNRAQYLIVSKLAQAHRNICVVGDDSQSIYSFRGARIENILRFQKDYPEAKVFRLEQNYRSTQTIVEAAGSLIEHNSNKLPKKLFSENEKGEPIRVLCAMSDRDEARLVAEGIRETIYRDHAEPSEFAVLYRTNAQSRTLEDALRERNIPYRIWGGHSFYQRAEIKDAVAYLRMAVNPRDNESLRRIINTPARGIGETSLQKITAEASAAGVSMWEVLTSRPPAELGIRGPAVKALEAFVTNFSELFRKAPQMDAWELAMEVMTRSGMIQHYKMSRDVEDESRLQNIEELLNSIKEFVEKEADEFFDDPDAVETTGEETIAPTTAGANSEAASVMASVAGFAEAPAGGDEPKPVTIDRWLQEVALLTDADTEENDNQPRVTLLTVHAAKGLEFPHIYIVGLEENLFPSLHGAAFTAEEIEEERRLFYVALTRAEKRATLTFALSRFKWGDLAPCSPSRFLSEIDPQHLDLSQGSLKPKASFPGTDTGDGAQKVFRRFNAGGRPGSSYGPKGQGSTPGGYGGSGAGRAPKAPPVPEKPLAPPAGFRKVVSGRVPIPSQTPPTEDSRPLASAGNLSVGTAVEHARFGRGTVEKLEQTATDTKVTVDFGSNGVKVLLLKFAKLRVI